MWLLMSVCARVRACLLATEQVNECVFVLCAHVCSCVLVSEQVRERVCVCMCVRTRTQGVI
jgi:hypothetical protein